ncbi:Signal peptidase complex subunit 3 [Cocos nucifera]|uniref:Signal peptidase complex subunit 3 n=1 Tax=Cocos nucifera TaxID=13894 RepID=A0A8K0HZ60_COCNU|nr:Signal peptidase complex subunit 3 [Cocos nucifera]
MHSFMYRLNTLVTFAAVLLAVLCAAASFLDAFNSPSVHAHAEVIKINRFRKQLSGNDEGNNLRGKKFELVLHWHVMPRTGRMIQDKMAVSSFYLPEAYT